MSGIWNSGFDFDAFIELNVTNACEHYVKTGNMNAFGFDAVDDEFPIEFCLGENLDGISYKAELADILITALESNRVSPHTSDYLNSTFGDRCPMDGEEWSHEDERDYKASALRFELAQDLLRTIYQWRERHRVGEHNI